MPEKIKELEKILRNHLELQIFEKQEPIAFECHVDDMWYVMIVYTCILWTYPCPNHSQHTYSQFIEVLLVLQ